jgi:hypothetical protein
VLIDAGLLTFFVFEVMASGVFFFLSQLMTSGVVLVLHSRWHHVYTKTEGGVVMERDVRTRAAHNL